MNTTLQTLADTLQCCNPSQLPMNPPQSQDSLPQVIPQVLMQNSGSIPPAPLHQMNNLDPKRHRRSKHEKEGRIYDCICGKSYLSQPALNNHKKSKHPELNANGEKRGRGRPRKYLPNFPGDFETNKYDHFFEQITRKKENNKPLDMNDITKKVYDFLYCGEYKDKLYSRPQKVADNALLENLLLCPPISNKDKKEKSCDEVLYEYLTISKEKTNDVYYTLLLEFIILFRECFNNSKADSEGGKSDEEREASKEELPESLPELCNEFYTNFMENNNFFGLNSEQDKNEIIEMIQHFCIWLFRSEYTKSKLALAQ